MMKNAVTMVVFLAALTLSIQATAASFEGIVRPAYELELAFPIDGVVSNIFMKEGDRVSKGGKILKLNDTLQKLEVDRKKQIYDDSAEYESNKNNMEIIKQLLDSSKDLYEKTGSVSLDEVNSLQMQYHTLRGRVEGHESKKKQELIEYELAKEVLDRYLLKSPISGIVTQIKPEEGEWVKAGKSVVMVADKSVCYVEINLEEKYALTLKKGKVIPLSINQGADRIDKKGRVIFVSPVADKASALVRVKVEFKNEDGKVTPGVLASISF